MPLRIGRVSARAALLVLVSFLVPYLAAQSSPACTQRGSITTATHFTALPNNSANPNCNSWALTWSTQGFSAVTIQFEGSDNNSSWTAFSGSSTVVVGTNPASTLSGTIVVQASSTNAYVRVNVTSVTGTGAVNFQLYGYNGVTPTAKNGAGSACGALGGDLSGSCGAATVVGIQGHAVSGVQGNGAKAQVSTGTTTTNDCVKFDANGNTVDAGAACGSATTVPFSGVTSGTNTGQTLTAGNGTTVTTTGTGVVNANQVNGGTVPISATAAATNSSGQIVAATYQGNGAKVQLSTGTTTLNDCVKFDANGNTVDAGAACGSGGGGGGGVTIYSGSTVAYSGTMYFAAGGGAAVSSTEASVQTASPASATISNLQVQLSQALGAGNSAVFTWRDGGSSQPVTCTISGASATSCSDTAHSFNASAGDLLDIQAVVTGTVAVTPTTVIASAFGTSNVGVTSVTATAPITSSGGTTPNISATYQGNGSMVQLSTGTTTTNDCVKFDANGNTVDAGAACGGGGGGSPDWFIGWPGAVTPPTFAGWINQNNYTITTSGNDIYLASPGTHTAFYIAARYKAKIASTFTLTVGMVGNFNPNGGCFAGIFVSPGSAPSNAVIAYGLEIPGGGFGGSYMSVGATLFNTFTNSFNANYFSALVTPTSPFVWLRIQEDATHRTFYFSADGTNFLQVYQQAVTTAFTTADYGIVIEGGNNAQPFGTHYSYITETNP